MFVFSGHVDFVTRDKRSYTPRTRLHTFSLSAFPLSRCFLFLVDRVSEEVRRKRSVNGHLGPALGENDARERRKLSLDRV